MRRTLRQVALVAIAALIALAVRRKVRGGSESSTPVVAESARAVEAPSRGRARAPTSARRRPGSAPTRRAAASAPLAGAACEPYVRTDCFAGDVYWFDSCGRELELEEDCGEGFCRGGACVAGDWAERCDSPPQGRCDGNVLRVCDRGEELSIDCGAQGKVCARGAEGAVCRQAAPECEPGPPHCVGETLRSCEGGRAREVDCASVGGRCIESPGAGAACVLDALELSEVEQARCGPCGCPRRSDGSSERCNGLDDDGDGYVDEGAECDPVALDVWVGPGTFGEPVIDAQGLAVEVAHVNASFAESGSTIRFELGEVRALRELGGVDAPDIAFEDLIELLDVPGVADGEPALRVRLLVVKRLLEEGVPRLGVAVPFVAPGCGQILEPGGRRRDRALIAIAQARTPTTLTHELGHHFGLCHTHERERPATLAPVASEDPQTRLVCGELCSHDGDAICDTPADSEACAYEPESCFVHCPEGQRPDPSNVMSYYHACREGFSAQQVELMEHTVALRRAWRRCRDGACECALGRDDCPLGMSCRPAPEGQVPRCGMDGPRYPRQGCQAHEDCSGGAVCLAAGEVSLCVRPCALEPGEAGESISRRLESCHCSALPGLDLAVCREDLRPALITTPHGAP